jgi:hypothetical protein
MDHTLNNGSLLIWLKTPSWHHLVLRRLHGPAFAFADLAYSIATPMVSGRRLASGLRSDRFAGIHGFCLLRIRRTGWPWPKRASGRNAWRDHDSTA